MEYPDLSRLLLLLAVLAVSAGGVSAADDYDDSGDLDMCQVDQLAAALCDVCQIVQPTIPQRTCCSSSDVMWQCETLLKEFVQQDEALESINSVESDYADYGGDDGDVVAEKRAAWSWKKPASNRLSSELWDVGFRGKRYSWLGWKPAAYRMDRDRDVGFRGKRFYPDDPVDYDEEAAAAADGDVSKRARSPGYYDWKPAAYYSSAPNRFDRLSYYGKRSEDSSDVEKRSFRWYGWKPAPYRLDSGYMWDTYGKRGYYSSPRFGWKPHSSPFERYLYSKRGWWGPSRPARQSVDYDGSEKRFNIGLGRWDWNPQSADNRDKRGRWDWKPSTGYVGSSFNYGYAGYDALPGKRPYARLDWKPANSRRYGGWTKRDTGSSYWKPWRPASYNGRVYG